jgi:acyl-CoA synthetase (AMP-forming)/AMP-acid ligase II
MDYNFDLGIEQTEEFLTRSSSFTIGDQLRKSARMWPDHVALAEPDRELTFAELDERTDDLARGLLDAGYEPNESTMAVLAENRGETVELLLACAKIGVLVATLNWRLEREELIHCIDLAEPEGLVVSGDFCDRISWIDADAESNPEIIPYDDGHSFSDLISSGATAGCLRDIDVNPEQGWVVLNTSGTTGLPKGVVLSHRVEFARAVQVTIDYGLESGDSYPAWPPMFHMGGIDWIVVTVFLGGTFYPIGGFEPDRILDVLLASSDPISWLYLVPGTIEPIVERAKQRDIDPADLPEIRTMGALPDLVAPDRIQEATETFGTQFQNTYGSSEIGHGTSGSKLPVGLSPSERDLAKIESPLVELKLIDEDRTTVETRGELAARGPTLFSGYIDAPETNEADFQNGWFRTGDIFTRGQDGAYSFVSRRKYLIKSGGENIYPAELEEPIAELDGVEEVIAVRTDDDEWGEVPRVVVGTTSIDDANAMRGKILSKLEDEIARYKLPHYVEFCDPADFPRSTSGKIVRPDVEDWSLEGSTRVRNP